MASAERTNGSRDDEGRREGEGRANAGEQWRWEGEAGAEQWAVHKQKLESGGQEVTNGEQACDELGKERASGRPDCGAGGPDWGAERPEAERPGAGGPERDWWAQDEGEVEAERRHFESIVRALRFYKTHSLRRVQMAEKYFSELPPHQRALLPRHPAHLSDLRVCVEHNAEIIKLILAATDDIFDNRAPTSLNGQGSGGGVGRGGPVPSEFDMDKVRSTLKQFVRDWSEEGAGERLQCYQPIIDDILWLYPDHGVKGGRGCVSVLVPGAGLGRLAFELARHGLSCQGNEFSLFMLFASNFVINKCKRVNAYTLYPWVHQFCNNLSSANQTQAIRFPDVAPSCLPPGASFSMAAGDFLDVYTDPDQWDCVATVFFLDTAHNVIDYVETIHRILKPGGHWLNLGPLLYHFADMRGERSIELSYEELRAVILQLGFQLVREQTHVTAGYTQNSLSMLRYQYDCVYFIARKPLAPHPADPTVAPSPTDSFTPPAHTETPYAS